MNRILHRYDRLIPSVVLLFSSLIIGASFIFNSETSLLYISVFAVLPAVLYLLFFRKKYFFPVLVFFVPLSVSLNLGGGTMADFPAEPLIGLFVAVLLVFWILKSDFNKSILTHPVSILIMMELVWMIICAINGVDPVVSYKRCIVRFSFIAVFYILFSQWMERPRSGINLFVIYAAACVIPIIHGFIFHAHFDFNYVASYLMPRPFFIEHTIYGACLAFLIPMLILLLLNAKEFGIRNWNFALLFLLTLLVSAGEFLSFSRAAWVSLGVAFLLRLLILIRIKLWMILVLLFVGGSIVYKNSETILELIKRNEKVSNSGDISDHLMSVTNLQSDASNLERINRWKCAIRMVKARPLTGFGPGTYQFEYGQFQSRIDMTRISTFNGTNGHSHSELFNALSEEGIPGGLIYLLIMFSVLGYGLRVIYKSSSKQEQTIALGALLGLLTFYVHGFFNAFLDTDKMAVLVFGSIAIIVYLDIQQRKTLHLKKNHD